MADKLPWELCPALTRDRLCLIARTIANARQDCLAHYMPEKGDDPWCHGCRAYRWSCHELRALTVDPANSWLTIIENRLEFEMSVEGQAIRFYKGDADKPKTTTLEQALPWNLSQQSLFGDVELLDDDILCWLLAVETDRDGAVVRIVVVQASRYDVRNQWTVPLETPVAVVTNVTSFEREPVDLPPPAVGPKDAPAEKASGSGEGNEDS